MTYTLHFLPELEDDAAQAYAWYEAKAKGLGEEFLRIFYAYANEISRNPLLSPKLHGEFRRRLLKRFPYAIYFVVRENEVIVIGLFHCARNPRAIRKHLQNRNG